MSGLRGPNSLTATGEDEYDLRMQNLWFRIALCALPCACGSDKNDASSGATEPSSTSSSTGETGEVSLLESCVFAEPCDYDVQPGITEGDGQYQDALCAFALLRDAAPARVDLTGTEMESLIPLGDGQRGVLVVVADQGGESVQRCTLAEAAFFQACIDDGPDKFNEACAFASGWYDGCVAEPAPLCPAD